MDSATTMGVISGISGRINECKNLTEFWTKYLKPTSNFANGLLQNSSYQNGNNNNCNLQAILKSVLIEAILDAGINPVTLRGKHIGIFISSSSHSSQELEEFTSKLALTFGFNGPTNFTDTTNSSSPPSLYPFYEAVQVLHNSNEIEGVLVANVGQNGSVIAVFIQKQYYAKRMYLTIANCAKYLETVPACIKERSDKVYVGTGERISNRLDKEILEMSEECAALNLNSSEEENGIQEDLKGFYSIVKLILKLGQGQQPIKADSHNFCINSMGNDGNLVHFIFKSTRTEVKSPNNRQQLPALIPISSHSQENVESSLALIQELERNSAVESLLREVTQVPIIKHTFRGFVLKSDTPVTSTQEIPQEKRPLWFIFSGMGTLWPGMMNGLMEFEVFAQSIQRATEIMKPYGIDLADILMNGDESVLDRYMGVCFIAVGIALTDLLIALELTPDGYIGHSGGEILCAYIDGCISQSEALISYYWKDELVLKCQNGAMASIRLTWEKAKAKCPPWIYPACYNSANNVTISGLKEDVTKFLTKLSVEQNISSSLVNTNGVAYHTRYLKPMWAEYETLVKNTVQNTKSRSNKWLSTSIPEKEWETGKHPYTGMADYLLHNMKSPVLFYPVLKFIPKNAIVLEISANSFFCNSLEKSLGKTNLVLGLLRKNDNGNTNCVQLLNTIGKLYNFGMNPKINNIYHQNCGNLQEQEANNNTATTTMISPIFQGLFDIEDFDCDSDG